MIKLVRCFFRFHPFSPGPKPVSQYQEKQWKEEPKKDSKSEEVDTSVIYPLKKGEESWNYIKTKDGKEGWIDAFESNECFELLNVAG